MNHAILQAVEAFRDVCQASPSVARAAGPRHGVGLYGWNSGPVPEVHIPKTRELIMTAHLGGSRRVRVLTGAGLSRSFSRPGDITLIPRGQPISFRTEGAVEFASIHFSTDGRTSRHSAELERIVGLPHCRFAFRDPYVMASVQTLMRAAAKPSRESARYSARLFDALIAHVALLVEEGNDAEQIELPSRTERGISQPDFDAVLAHITQHLAEKLSLEELADCAGVSRALFAREFTARFACSPHRYLMLMRIARAKQLMQDNALSLTDIAYEVGFSGHSHFSSTFKAIENCSPREFASALRK